MKLKRIAPLLLSLLAAPAFAHSQHDDEDQLPLKPEVTKPVAPTTSKAKPAHKPAAKKAVPAPAAEAAPVAPKQP